ncbi:MAG: glutamate-5-semialdehyde dehydrogenase [Buchananella hordeovulneris]|nr:glutamate-5-semialdehyde dehydrogenase [Buchananella hordeovulneris]
MTDQPVVAATDDAAAQAVTGVYALARAARVAARQLATATAAQKNAALASIASALLAQEEEILAGNAVDLEAAKAAGMAPGLQDRLLLTDERLAAIAASIGEVAALPDPVGEVVRGQSLPNGLRVRQTRVPLGVVGMIYEARPNVTVDAAVLALKSGNAVLLRGGSAAENSNRALIAAIKQGLESAGFSADLVATVDPWGREGAKALMQARGLVDVLIPRGGAGLIQAVVRDSTVPSIETGVGNCHVYVDQSADLAQAHAICMNAKTHRVGVCNAAETLLVHSAVAGEFLPGLLKDLAAQNVVLHGCEKVAQIAAEHAPEVSVLPATEEDWDTEYLAYEVAIGVVDSLDDALEHVRAYSSGHTEAIVTASIEAARRFTTEVDAAAIAVNASTRFTDGGQLGLGAEIGISTQKLHARGPMGLAELTTTTWIIEGDGHIRT